MPNGSLYPDHIAMNTPRFNALWIPGLSGTLLSVADPSTVAAKPEELKTERPTLPKFEDVTRDMKADEGLFTLCDNA